MLATGGDSIKLWDINDFKLQQIFPSKLGSAIHSVSWNNNGGCLGSVSNGSSEVALRAIKDSSSLELPPIKAGSIVRAVDHAPKAACYLAVAESSGSVVVWDAKQLTPKKLFQLKGEALTDVAFSPWNSHLAVSSEGGEVHLLSLTNNAITGPHRITREQGGVHRLQYSTVRRGVLGAACWNGAVAHFDCSTGKLSRMLQAHTAPCAALSFSPINDLLLVSAGYDKKLIFYDTNSLKTAQVVTCDSPLTAVAFLPGGLKVCVGTQCGAVQVRDLRSLRSPLHTWSAHAGPVTALAPQPTPTGSLRKRKAAPISHKLNKSLPDDSPQETETRLASTLPTPKAGTPASRAFVPSGLDDLCGDILSPVRDSAPSVEPAVKQSRASEGAESAPATAAGQAVAQGTVDARISARDSKFVSSHILAGRNASFKSNIEEDADIAFDPDDILSPVRTNGDDNTPALPFTSHERHRVAAGGEYGCSPALSSRRDESIRSSLLRMAAGESKRSPRVEPRLNLNSPQLLSGLASASISSPLRLSGRISTSLQPLASAKFPTSLNSGVPAPERTVTADDRTMARADSTSLHQPPDASEHALHTDESKLKQRDFAGNLNAVAQQVQVSDTPSSVLLDGESKTQNSPVPSLRSLSDELFSPLRDTSTITTTPSSSVLSSKKISDRIAVIEDLIKSGSPRSAVPHKTNHRGNVSSMSPHNKENDAPAVSPLSPSFDPPSARNTTLNCDKPGTPRASIRYVENSADMADCSDIDEREKLLKNVSRSERKPAKPPLSPPSIKRLQKNYDSIVSKIKQMEQLTENSFAAAASNSDTSNAAHAVGTSAILQEHTNLTGGASAGTAEAASSQSLTLALVRSCIADALEEFEIGVNRRFMHLHYTLLSTLVQQTREIEELHKKYSLNEELLEENLRLQEEIRYLRANY